MDPRMLGDEKALKGLRGQPWWNRRRLIAAGCPLAPKEGCSRHLAIVSQTGRRPGRGKESDAERPLTRPADGLCVSTARRRTRIRPDQ